MPYSHVNAANIYYQQTWAGPDPVFLHGAGGNHLSWWRRTPAFVATSLPLSASTTLRRMRA